MPARSVGLSIIYNSAKPFMSNARKRGLSMSSPAICNEMFGDRRDDLHLAPQDIAAIHNLKQANIPVVLILISGRPLFLDNVLNDVDAIVAAWLPGTEGEGVADVLFGDYKPAGKLYFTWPKASSTTLHRGGAGYETLFAFGYGLSY